MKRLHSAGITQLELMISLAIMGFVTVLLASALNFERQTIERFGLIAAETTNLVNRRTLRALTEQIPLSSEEVDADALLEGSDASMRFWTQIASDSFWGGALTEIVVETHLVEGEPLLLARGRGKHPSEQEPVELEWVLAGPVENVSISYFGRISEGSEREWRSHWSNASYLPELIKLEWEDPGGFPVPPLTLQPAKVELQRYMSLSSLVPPD